jgi:hypothetical protein
MAHLISLDTRLGMLYVVGGEEKESEIRNQKAGARSQNEEDLLSAKTEGTMRVSL